MKTNVIVELTQIDQLELIQKQVFNVLDISESTRKEYSVRIRHFIRYTQAHGINSNTYLYYKSYLSATETFSIATKNKYLIAAKVFLDGLYRLQIIPILFAVQRSLTGDGQPVRQELWKHRNRQGNRGLLRSILLFPRI